MELDNKELTRYARHLNLPQFGPEQQKKLKTANVLVVGAGGLGAPILQYLTAAGVGMIGIVDDDVVDLSNLQRQVLFDEEDIDKPKVQVAIQKLHQQNSQIQFKQYQTKFTSENAFEILEDYDLVVDGTDNFATRYLVNDACVLKGIPFVYGSIYQYEGQVSIFNYQDGPNYRDLFPNPPVPGMVPSCAEGGVLGVLPGIIGSMQASEAIKILAGIGTTLSGRLFLYDALDFTARTINIAKDPSNPISGKNPTIHSLIDYDEFCGLKPESTPDSISVQELKSWIEKGIDFTLIDVRELREFETGNMGGLNVPLTKLVGLIGQIPTDGKVVVHCKTGGRSAQAINRLSSKYGYTNLINLEGGILAWKREFKPELRVV